MPKPALVINTLIGYGDNLWLTPILRFLKQCDFAVDLYTVSDEVFKNNPDIVSTTSLRNGTVMMNRSKYGKNIFIIEDIGTSSASNHTIDTLTKKIANVTLREIEKGIVYNVSDSDIDSVNTMLNKHNLKKYVVVSPVITWPSRTLPLDYYKGVIEGLLSKGIDVVLVGKDVDPRAKFGEVAVSDKIAKEEVKGLYSSSNFPGAIDLTNQLSFGELAALYKVAPVTINTESLGVVLAGLGDCWNIFITSLTAPEFRLPWRNGSQSYKTVVIENGDKWYPSHNYDVFKHLDMGELDLRKMTVKVPTVKTVLDTFDIMEELFFL